MDRLEVTQEELSRAIKVWFTTMPPDVRSVWKEVEKYERLKAEKRHDPEREPDPRGVVALYIADQFAKVKWTVTREVPKPLGSPPNWKGDR